MSSAPSTIEYSDDSEDEVPDDDGPLDVYSSEGAPGSAVADSHPATVLCSATALPLHSAGEYDTGEDDDGDSDEEDEEDEEDDDDDDDDDEDEGEEEEDEEGEEEEDEDLDDEDETDVSDEGESVHTQTYGSATAAAYGRGEELQRCD